MLVIYQKQFITVKMIVFCNNTSTYFLYQLFILIQLPQPYFSKMLRRLIEGGGYLKWYIFSAAVNRGRRYLEVLQYVNHSDMLKNIW